jgi:hypothetical protein
MKPNLNSLNNSQNCQNKSNMRRYDRKGVLSVILRHLSASIFSRQNMLFFTASFDVTVEAKCITYVTLDSIWHHWHPFCISECIGPAGWPDKNACQSANVLQFPKFSSSFYKISHRQRTCHSYKSFLFLFFELLHFWRENDVTNLLLKN